MNLRRKWWPSLAEETEEIEAERAKAAADLAIAREFATHRGAVSLRKWIEDEILPRIFEPLYSTRAFVVGLGLPLGKQVMLEHGGDVEIGTASLGGAKVVLWLPVPREPAALRRRA